MQNFVVIFFGVWERRFPRNYGRWWKWMQHCPGDWWPFSILALELESHSFSRKPKTLSPKLVVKVDVFFLFPPVVFALFGDVLLFTGRSSHMKWMVSWRRKNWRCFQFLFGGWGGWTFLNWLSTVNCFAQIRGMNFQGFAVCHTSLLFFWLFFSISCQGLKNDGICNIVFWWFKEDIQWNTLVSVWKVSTEISSPNTSDIQWVTWWWFQVHP